MPSRLVLAAAGRQAAARRLRREQPERFRASVLVGLLLAVALVAAVFALPVPG